MDPIDIIMLNMSTQHDWDSGISNRNRQILSGLLKDDRVRRIVAVDFFPMKLKTAARHYCQNILFAKKKNSEVVYGDLTSVCYQKTSKLFVYSSMDSVFSWKTVARELRRVEKLLGLERVVMWSYNAFFPQVIGKLREELFVFDAVDNWLEHSEYTKLVKPSKLRQNYQEIADKADLIFTVSEDLVEFFKQLNRSDKTYFIPNGVDFEHLNNPEKINQLTALEKIKEPIIGYLGTITADRIDFKLVKYLAENNLDKKIVLAGPIWPSAQSKVDEVLAKHENIIVTGRISWDEAPAIFHKFDVAIIPHLKNDFIKSTNPMKLYDYLACGTPVVSTSGSGVEIFKDLIAIEDDYGRFNIALNLALKDNSEAKIQARQAEVKEHQWSNRVRQMLDLIFNNLKTV